MPEYVKVGRTNNIERRIKDLSKDTSVPLPFECYAYLCVYGGGETSATVEKSLHFYLGEKYTKNKEFFKTSKEVVVNFFRTALEINPTMELVFYNKQEASEKTQASSRTTFALLNIPAGSELVYKPNTEIKCGGFVNGIMWTACFPHFSHFSLLRNSARLFNDFWNFFIVFDSFICESPIYHDYCRHCKVFLIRLYSSPGLPFLGLLDGACSFRSTSFFQFELSKL